MSRKKRLVIANWKMHPGTLAEARKLFRAVASKVSRVRSSTIVICPPTLYMSELVSGYGGTTLSFGAQDCSTEREEGSFTGETSPLMLKRLGVEYVILGHSERRAKGETDALVAKKVRTALSVGLTAVLCVGELTRDSDGRYLQWLEHEIRASLDGISKQHVKKVIVAYEPVWAIGKTASQAIKPEDLHHMSLFIRKVLVKKYGRKMAGNIKIIYGGSVEPSNSNTLFEEGMVDGFLPGHASLVPNDFLDIVR